jgi:hypothetical protein
VIPNRTHWSLILIWTSALWGSGCVLDERPGLRACAGGYPWQFRRGPSDGDLGIVPSALPGVEVDSAGWLTYASAVALGAEVRLVYAARLRLARRLELDSIALIYRAQGSRRLFSPEAHDEGWSTVIDGELQPPQFTGRPAVRRMDPEDREHTVAPAGSLVRTERDLTIDNGPLVISSTGADICPRSVQVIPRQDLLRYVAPELFTSARIDDLLAKSRAGSAEPSPLEVVFDTLLPDGRFGGLITGGVVTGIAVNTTDSTLPPMVAAIVVDSAHPARPTDGPRTATLGTRDTLEYYLGPVAPRAVRTFLGGRRVDGEVVVERISYPASAIQDRRIATGLDRHWTSRARHREPDKVRELEAEPSEVEGR